MKIEVAGVSYEGFEDATLTRRLDALSDSFSFSVVLRAGGRLPFRGGEACRVTVDDELALTGHVEVVTANGDSESYSATIEGRDRTGDLLDSTIGSMAPISGASVTMRKLCERVIDHLGLDLEVEDRARPAAFSVAEDVAAPEPGEGAFAWLEKYSRKRGVLLTSNPEGNLVIARGEGVEIDAEISNRIGDPESSNNVESYSVSYDSTGRFNLYRVLAQLNPAIPDLTGAGANAVANQGGASDVRDAAVRAGRQLVLVSEAAASTAYARDRATWEAAIRKTRGRVYSATLVGFRTRAGALWTTNVLPLVVDEKCGISARMLVNSVTFALGPGGRSTTLSLVPRNSYRLTLDEPESEEVGNDFFA